jgi:Proteasomal ATPase OB C-terminal domain
MGNIGFSEKPMEDKEKKFNERKEENLDYITSYTKHLERKIRTLEAEKQLLESEKIRLDREVRAIKTELDRMRMPPLVLARVVKVLEDGRIIVKSSTGPEFAVKYSSKIPKEQLTYGTTVMLNQRTFSIIEIVSGAEKIPYNAIGAWMGIPYEVKIIEVQDWDELAPNLEKHFSINLKSLDDLISIAKDYRIPVIFKKAEEYLAIYFDTPLFWFKPKL